jgi:hypothetical protein
MTRPPKRSRKAGPEQLHESGADHQVGPEAGHLGGQPGVPVGAIGTLGQRFGKGRDAGLGSSFEGADAGPIGADGDDLDGQIAGLAGVDESLQQGP